MTDTIILQTDNDWATLWLNRPDARNAMSGALLDDLKNHLEALAKRDDIRGITLRGKGEVFCAGGDLRGFQNDFQNTLSEAEVIAESSQMGEFFLRVRSMPQVVVSLVHGAAMAGGLGMSCAADIIIATKDTRMALTETGIGVVPAQIARYIVERMGEFHARRVMLTAHRFTAVEGATMGLVDILVDDMAAAEAAEAEIKAGVRRCAPKANAATKALLEQNKILPTKEMIHYAGQAFARSVQSAEGREGVASFLEKRKPSWSAK
ncbi:MAG: hypothetical protein HAW65_06220 [Alphaproteobacteria bacterium]|nr:hypothetical protein [Alphaproteobacteria bacterium]MBE8220886.1 hypothetical protein [Alphaproteobacteria bacterium]